jgi:cytochrome c553
MKSHIAIPLSISAAIFCWLGAPAQAQEAARVAAQVCSSCHGPNGDSISPGFPKIGGQRPDYLEAQLKAFRDRTRADPMAQAYMWGMTSQLGDDMIKNLAAFYSGQKPPKGRSGDPKLVQAGKAIYERGLPQAKVPPCSTCHGPNAEGNAGFPRLAGQHAEYLVKQLVLFKSSMRTGGQAVLMHNISTEMSFDQMEAVAAFLASK